MKSNVFNMIVVLLIFLSIFDLIDFKICIGWPGECQCEIKKK